jgi:hypothetical protein
MAHTPGPWFVKFCGDEDKGSACRISADPLCTDSYEGIMYDGNYDECGHLMTLDDARLIAAAPDMYAACSIMRNQHEEMRGHCNCVLCNAARKAERK